MKQAHPTIRLLSCPIQLFTKQDLLNLVVQNIKVGQVILAHQNLHGAALLRQSTALQRFFEIADYCSIDGMPFVWLARLCGFPARPVHRNTQLDWISDLLARLSEARSKLFFIGSPPDTAEKISLYLQHTYPGLEVYVHHGYLSPDDAGPLRARINEVAPDLIILGMGMPRQELWLLENFENLPFGLAMTSGAALEYYAGAQKPPARLSGRLGFEWLVRLWNEPRRLGRRYLVEPWTVVFPALADIWYYRMGKGRMERRLFQAEICRQTSKSLRS
jgi:N-acetylglucosaminyldiphosphoundecaprenol N-acetyl-beta-D-mannosaminyltransferase